MTIQTQRDATQIMDDYEWVGRLIELLERYGTLSWQDGYNKGTGYRRRSAAGPDQAHADVIDHLRVKFPDLMDIQTPKLGPLKEQPVDQPQPHAEPRPRHPSAVRAHDQIHLHIQALGRTISSFEIDQAAAEALTQQLDTLKIVLQSRVRLR